MFVWKNYLTPTYIFFTHTTVYSVIKTFVYDNLAHQPEVAVIDP